MESIVTAMNSSWPQPLHREQATNFNRQFLSFITFRRMKSSLNPPTVSMTVSCRSWWERVESGLNTFSLCFVVLAELCQLTPPYSKAPQCCTLVLRCSALHASYLLPTDSPSAPRTCCFVSSQEHWSREDWVLVLLDRENHSAQQAFDISVRGV